MSDWQAWSTDPEFRNFDDFSRHGRVDVGLTLWSHSSNDQNQCMNCWHPKVEDDYPSTSSVISMELKFSPVFLLLGLYIFTGCDQLSSFNTITTERVFKVFTALVQRDDLNILHAISCLGQDEVPSPQLKRSLERLVLKLYIKNGKNLKWFTSLGAS